MQDIRRLPRSPIAAFVCAAILAPTLWAQSTLTESAVGSHAAAGAGRDDPEFARLVRQWTTSPEFSSPLVDHLPLAPGIPTPKDVLGYHIGAPQKLTYTEHIYDYYRQLAAKTPRVKVTAIGQTDEGRDILIVYVGSEDSVGTLETYRGYLAQLADPRGLTEAQARDIVSKARPIYFLSGGLHSGETGAPEMLMELTYRLAVEDTPLIRQIREEVIVAILPVAEPDGRDRYVDWYYKYLVDVTDERNHVPDPPYWGKYIYHDNNRDINFSQLSMRALLDWYLQWHPPIMHDLHESLPFMYTFSGQAPQNPTLDPLLYAELPWFANFEMAQMTKYGMPGVWTHGFVDMWSPGYLNFMASNHNGMIRMYETFGNGGATTMKRRVANPDSPGGNTTREWFRPLPPYKEVVWSMRNNTNYMETGVLTALQLTSHMPDVVLENFYTKSRNSIDAGRKEAPHAFIIPADQEDRTRVATLVSLLRLQGIEVGRAKIDYRSGGAGIAAGDFVIKRNQPYGRLAKILLEKQDFPDPALRTYDDTGWTMGLMLQVDVKPVADEAVLDVPTELLTSDWKPAGTLTATSGDTVLVVPNHGSNNLVTLRYRLRDFDVQATERSYTPPEVRSADAGKGRTRGTVTNGTEVPPGSYVIPLFQNGRNISDAVRAQIEPLGLATIGLARLPDVPMHAVDLPRLAVFSTWGSTQEVGWVRYTFDRFEIPYDLIYKERVRAGGLRNAYEVIVVPNQGQGTAKSIVLDIESKGTAYSYTKSDQFKTLGTYGESDDITGGMGLEGVVELREFVEEGGVLVTLAGSSYLAPEYGLTPGINAQRPSPQFYAPGPIIQAEVLKPLHPLLYGYRDRMVPVRYGNGPLLSVPEENREDQIVMRYPGGDAGVLSGLMKNAGEIRNRPAIVDVPVRQGRVVLFAGNPCYRWQNHGEFGMLFNSILHWNDRPREGGKALPMPTAVAIR
jgi:hypothetical protein